DCRRAHRASDRPRGRALQALSRSTSPAGWLRRRCGRASTPNASGSSRAATGRPDVIQLALCSALRPRSRTVDAIYGLARLEQGVIHRDAGFVQSKQNELSRAEFRLEQQTNRFNSIHIFLLIGCVLKMQMEEIGIIRCCGVSISWSELSALSSETFRNAT